MHRSPENPILVTDRANAWEAEAVFNGCPVKHGKEIHLVYRAVSSLQNHYGRDMHVSSIGHAQSLDGIHFKNRRQLIKPEYEWEQYGCEDPRVTYLDGTYYIFYTALSAYPFTPDSIRIGVAITKDLKHITAKYLVTPFNAKAMALFPEKINGQMAAILTVHTDKPPAKICLALFDSEDQLWSPEYWAQWYATLDDHIIALQRTLNDHIEVGAPPLLTRYGWLVVYSYITNYFSQPRIFGIEAALLDLRKPQRILRRSEGPLMVPEESYERYGSVPNIIFPSGIMKQRSKVYLYYGAADTSVSLATTTMTEIMDSMIIPMKTGVRLERYEGNPIIQPRVDHAWESQATFNPGALYLGGKVHLLYRAMGSDNTSVFGYASSVDGFQIEERLHKPVYVPTEDFEKKLSHGNSGCEDPRLTKIGDRIYMCYTAFDGKHPPRVALTSIAVDDFLRKAWHWAKPVLLSPPNIDDKDACVLPATVDNHYLIFHRIEQSIWVDRVRDIGAVEKQWLHGTVLLRPRNGSWDSLKVGIATQPIKTKRGWILLYHGVSAHDNVYRVGAALLDSRNPLRVVARTVDPIFEPEAEYEKVGTVPNVVFPCGAVIIDQRLFVYYGGADKVVGVASIELRELFEMLPKKDHTPY